MKYLAFKFRVTPPSETACDVLAGMLGDIRFESFVKSGDGLEAYVRECDFTAQALAETLEEFPMPGIQVAYTCAEAEDKDWNEEWEKNFFRPVVVGGRCVIHSTFHRDVPAAEYDIAINPQMAFGTGHHETTRLVIGELLEADLNGKRVLDMGCGTSILAILARMKGAAECVAIDIDDWCVRNSLENIALNKLDGIRVMQGDASSLEALEPFDVVAANINRNILLADMAKYAARMKPRAALYLSGFYAGDVPALAQEAARCGLRQEGCREKNRWAALTLRMGGEGQEATQMNTRKN